MKIPASKVPAQVWADKARRRADLDEVESMLLSSWDDSKQVYRIGKERGGRGDGHKKSDVAEMAAGSHG